MNGQDGRQGVGCWRVALILCIALVHGLLYIFVVPPWQHYDEPNHFEYVWLAARRSQLPKPEDYDPDMRRAVALSMIEHGFFRGMSYQPDLEAADGKVWIGQYAQLNDPPLYYLLAGLPLRILPVADVTTQLYLARLVSLALYVLTIGMAFGLVGELTQPSSPLRWLVPLTMALIPAFTDLMTAVNNDVGAVAVFTLFLWGSVRFLQGGLRPGDMERQPAIASPNHSVAGGKSVAISRFFFDLAWVIGAALLCLLTKPSAFVALPLLLPVIYLRLLRGRGRWLAWGVLAAGGIVGVVILFQAPASSAFWYAEANQGKLTRQSAPDAPLGKVFFALETQPAGQAPRYRQLLANSDLVALAGQEVTLGAWVWASQPLTVTLLQVYIQGSTVLDLSERWAVDDQPRFHAFTFTVPPGAYRGWVNLTAQARVERPVQIYADGLVLAEGRYPLDQMPVFAEVDGRTGEWGGVRFVNVLRGASAEQTWPSINAQFDALSARLLPDQGRLALIAYTMFDWQAGGAYYQSTAVNLLKTFWAKFGWGHVSLRVNAVYYLLAWISLAGLVGALVYWFRHARTLPVATLACLGLSMALVWGNALVRGAIYVFQVNAFIPAARYAFPAMIPTVLLLLAGWLTLAGFLSRVLRLPLWLGPAMVCLALLALDVLALVSIAQFYA